MLLDLNFRELYRARETYLLAYLGWVYFDFHCFTLCLVLAGLKIDRTG